MSTVKCWAALAGCLLLCLSLWTIANVPNGDAGGYMRMLEYYLQSGKVDYMRWSQPTFIGMLPLAVPWAHAFGTSFASLNGLAVFYSLVLLLGLLVLLRRIEGGWFLLAAVLCFPDFLSSAPAFATDIPYLAYVAWFLIVQDKLETSPVWWPLWLILLLLAVLTRSFGLLLGLPMLIRCIRSERDAQAITGTVLWLVCIGIAFGLKAHLGINSLTSHDLTAIPAILHGQSKLFDVRLLCLTVLTVAAVSVPVLLQCQVPRLGTGTRCIILGVGLVLALHFWHNGTLAALGVPESAIGRVSLGLEVLLAPVGLLLIAEMLLASKADTHTLTLMVIIAGQILVIPIMLHPTIRYGLPPFIALLLLAARSIRRQPVQWRVGLALAALLTVANYQAAMKQRLDDAGVHTVCQAMLDRGVDVHQIEGGWSWFCWADLVPGQASPQNYVTQYEDLRQTARYHVATDGRPAAETVEIPLSVVGIPRVISVQLQAGQHDN